MSLRFRLTLTLGATFVVIWTLASAWLLRDLRNEVHGALDERLAASAHMVANLLRQYPSRILPGEVSQGFREARQGLPSGMACQVVSVRGEVVAQSQDAPQRSLGALGVGFHEREFDGVRWRSFTLRVNDIWVSTADRVDERDHLNNALLVTAAVPVAVALLGSFALLWFGIARALSPLHAIQAALLVRNEDALHPLNCKALPSELRPLVTSQNKLLDRLARAIERERELTANAAHELRSPLTAIKTHLQVARMTDGVHREQALKDAEQGSDRLNHTLEQLLLLARVEGSMSFDDGMTCRPAEIARQAMHDSTDKSQQVTLRVEGDQSEDAVQASALLAVAALRNLVENAMSHGYCEQAVELSVRVSGGWAQFSVRDWGPGVPVEQLSNVTTRFWRNSRKTGSGLGLAIVQAITDRYGGRLTFENMTPGLKATLTLPLRSRQEH